ncbi:MAG: hypothetical protein FWE06_06270 [Oscillospiraceae bacterium]|nr:hypothetical protein [Oscillospiraceae bacterium]
MTEKMDYFTVKHHYEQAKQILRLIPEDVRKEAADKVFRPQKSKTKQLER